MKKRPSKQIMSKGKTKPELIDPEYEAKLQERASLDTESLRLSDFRDVRLSDVVFRKDWTQLDPLLDTWILSKEKSLPLIDWLDEIDCASGPMVLLPLLNIPPEARPYFKALFKGLNFKHNRKRRRFWFSEHHQKLLGALEEVKHRPRGVKQAEAITKAAQHWGISESALTKVRRPCGTYSPPNICSSKP